MLTPLLGATFLFGLLGSLHCTVMCGPLIGVGASAERSRAGGALRYLSGRLAGHLLAGAILGWVGAEAGRLMSRSWLQVAVAASLAVFMFVRGVRLALASPRSERGAALVPLLRRPRSRALQAFFASLLPRRALPLGLATSVLPCGLLAGAWVLAASAAHPVHGALVMAVFSIATAPGLLAALLVGLRVAHLARRIPAAWQGALWCALGLFLGARPLLDRIHGCCH